MIDNDKKKGLAAKVRDYMKKVTVDPFGIEKEIKGNIEKYLRSFSDEQQLPMSNINIRINQNQGEPIAKIYNQNQLIRQITSNELIGFFTGNEERSHIDQEKWQQKVVSFLITYADHNKVDSADLFILLAKPKDNLILVAYESQLALGNILLSSLIKHFRT